MRPLFVTLLFLSITMHLNAQVPCNLDNSFATSGKLVADASRLGEHILIQNDGKILVACNPFGNNNAYIRRFNSDGSVDAGYGVAGKCIISVAEVATRINGMAFYNGNVYVCGSTSTNIGGTNTYVYAAAISPSGTLLNTFGVNGIVKFNANPDLYTSSDICTDATGGIYISGMKSLTELYVMKLLGNGGLDNSYDADGIVTVATGNNNQWYDVADMDIDKSNKIVIAGKKYKANNGNPDPNFWHIHVMRFNTNGSLDNTFANAGIGLYNSNPSHFDESKKIQVTPSGDYIVCGDTYDNTDYDYTVLKIRNNGDIETNFANQGWAIHDLEYNNEFENPLNAALMPDGRILITGNQGSGDTVYFSLLMLKPDGTRDNVFAPNGLYKNIFDMNNNSSSSGMALTQDAKIVLAGYTRTCANGVCGPLYMAVSRYIGGTNASPAGIQAMLPGDLQLYPNPAWKEEDVHIRVPQDCHIMDVLLTDMSGKVHARRFREGSSVIETRGLSAGLYQCMVQTSKGKSVQRLLLR